jgi:hypothetical protein
MVFFTVGNPFKVEFHRDNVLFTGGLPDNRRNVKFPESVIEMTLNSALEDLRATTLKAISGSLRKLEYLAGLQNSQGSYAHWGLARVHGELAANRALEQEHRLLLSKILSTPLRGLLADVEQSSAMEGKTAAGYLEQLAQRDRLLPAQPAAGTERHLNSVLQALLSLAKTRSSAIHPIA